jgi:hypothetical protein
MKTTIKQTVRVKPGGVIEIKDPELTPGERAEVTVEIDSPDARRDRAARLDAALKRTQDLPQARALTAEEIAAEIAAWRATQT